MTDANLACFMACAKMNSFTAAAKKLSLTPQAVSRSIQALEEEMGHQLFYRTANGFRMTHAGEIFMDWLTGYDIQLASAADRYYDCDNRKYELRIAFPEWLGLIPQAKLTLDECKQKFDGIYLETSCFDSEFSFSLLSNHRLDVVIVPDENDISQHAPDIFSTPVKNPISFCCVYGASSVSDSIQRILERPCLMYEDAPALRGRIGELHHAVCRAYQCNTERFVSVPNLRSALTEAAIGKGIVFVPDSVKWSTDFGDTLGSISLTQFKESYLPVRLFWQSGNRSEEIVNYFVERARDI